MTSFGYQPIIFNEILHNDVKANKKFMGHHI